MILKLKDKGTLVQKLQEKLNLQSDGDFGINTEKAVKDFQSSNKLAVENKLAVDGIAGNKTLELLGLDFSRYIKNGNNTDISWELPANGKGFRTYNRDSKGDQFGVKDTIKRAVEIAEEWNKINLEVDIQFGDISLLYGGDTPDHATHEHGKDIDIRPFRNDGKYLPVTYTDREYSRDITRDFLKLVKGKVKGVYFNDPVLIKENLCRYCVGHGNHLHLMF